MGKLLGTVGSLVGSVGVIVCLLSGLMRLAEIWNFGGAQARTVFLGGMGLMVAGCLGKLHEMVNR